MRRRDTIIAMTNPQLRAGLIEKLAARKVATHVPRDLQDLLGLLEERSRGEADMHSVLILEEAFIYPHVYEECVHIKAASRQPLTILLLVEPRTRTRSDWNGADHVLRLPMPAHEIADRAVGLLRGHSGESRLAL